MLGGLLTLTIGVAFDAVVYSNMASWRQLVFVGLATLSCGILCGILNVYIPGLITPSIEQLLKTVLGPLTGGFSLRYMNIWLGGARIDPLVHRLTVTGSFWMFIFAGLLCIGLWYVEPQAARELVKLSALALWVSVFMIAFTLLRAAKLGDPLAKWMAWNCVFLCLMIPGLYARALDITDLGNGVWLGTAICTVLFLMISTVLVLMRERDNRRLAQLAKVSSNHDPATGLPTGSRLLSQVEHSFWRTGRNRGYCTVVCLYLHNLYALSDAVGHGVENQILSTMAARIRRSVGFRCVVGLYHPRCFVVVIASDKSGKGNAYLIDHLQEHALRSMSVLGRLDTRHEFVPNISIGTLTVEPDFAQAAQSIDTAEQLALQRKPPAILSELDLAH